MSGSFNDPCNRIEAIPDDLKNVLSKFAIEYLTLRPPNIIEFGLEFFTNMQNLPIATPRPSRSFAELSLSMSGFSDSSGSESGSEKNRYYKSDTESAHLYEVLLETDYFKNHNDDGLFNAINQMYSVSIEVGESVQLMDDGSLYVIENGILNISAGDLHEKIGEHFGSFSLTQLKWKFDHSDLSISCDSDTMLWVLNGAAFQRCWMGDVHAKCRDYESILQFSQIFGCLADTERQMLADMMVTKRYQAEDVIFDAATAGNTAAGCYFIREGLVSLATNDGDGGIQTVLLKSGQHFGEINAKDEMILRSATAMTKVRCTHLNGKFIKDLIRHPFSKLHHNLCTQCKNEC